MNKPPSHEYGFRRAMSTLEDMPDYHHPRHQRKVIRLVKGQNLTADGVQWSTWTETTSTPTSKSSNYIATTPITVSWPGLEGFNVDEMEAGLTCALMATSTGEATSASTMAYRWEMKDDNESTYTAISTWKLVGSPGTSTGIERTVSGYVSLGSGYKKLPLLIRLRAYKESGQMGKVRIKNSSYVTIMPKKQS